MSRLTTSKSYFWSALFSIAALSSILIPAIGFAWFTKRMRWNVDHLILPLIAIFVTFTAALVLWNLVKRRRRIRIFRGVRRVITFADLSKFDGGVILFHDTCFETNTWELRFTPAEHLIDPGPGDGKTNLKEYGLLQENPDKYLIVDAIPLWFRQVTLKKWIREKNPTAMIEFWFRWSGRGD